jgi:hypothetical protein
MHFVERCAICGGAVTAPVRQTEWRFINSHHPLVRQSELDEEMRKALEGPISHLQHSKGISLGRYPMNKGKQVLLFIVLIGLMLMAVTCGPTQAEPTSTTPPAVPALPTATAEVAPQQTVVSSATETDVPPSVAGRYRLKTPEYEEDYDQAIEEDYYLVLNEDGTAQFEAEALASGEVSVEARGTWKLDGDGAIIEITELFGEPVETPEVLRYEYRDGFPVATEYAAGGTLYNLEEAEFTIGAG